MKLNTLSSVTKELSEIDLWVIEDILNAMRRKSWIQERWEIPPIKIRWWTHRELVNNILHWTKIATWQLIQSAEQVNQQINIIVPPIKITRGSRYSFTLIHELVHSFWRNIKGYHIAWSLQNLNEWLTDVIAIKVYQEYCYRSGIIQEVHNISYSDYAGKILKISRELEKRWYGDSETILKWFIQWYFEWIDIISSLRGLLDSGVNTNDVSFLIKELFSFQSNPT